MFMWREGGGVGHSVGYGKKISAHSELKTKQQISKTLHKGYVSNCVHKSVYVLTSVESFLPNFCHTLSLLIDDLLMWSPDLCWSCKGHRRSSGGADDHFDTNNWLVRSPYPIKKLWDRHQAYCWFKPSHTTPKNVQEKLMHWIKSGRISPEETPRNSHDITGNVLIYTNSNRIDFFF